MMKNYLPSQKGFTLIEVLIAMMIFAVLSVLAYGGLQQVINNREQTADSLLRLKDLQISMSKIYRDLTQITARQARDEQGSRLSSLKAAQGDELLIQLTRNGWRNPAKTNRGHLQRVAYRIDEDRLIRISWPYVDRALDGQAVETVLIDNIKDVKLRFLSEQNEWHTSWPSLNAAPDDASLPVAIEFTLQMEDWGDIIRIMRTTG